jgi:glutathione S-transferase
MSAEQFGTIMRELGTIHSTVGDVRAAQAKLTDHVSRIDADVKRANEVAAEAKRIAEGSVHTNAEVHRAMVVAHGEQAKALRTVQAETEVQTGKLDQLLAGQKERAAVETAVAEALENARVAEREMSDRRWARAEKFGKLLLLVVPALFAIFVWLAATKQKLDSIPAVVHPVSAVPAAH